MGVSPSVFSFFQKDVFSVVFLFGTKDARHEALGLLHGMSFNRKRKNHRTVSDVRLDFPQTRKLENRGKRCLFCSENNLRNPRMPGMFGILRNWRWSCGQP